MNAHEVMSWRPLRALLLAVAAIGLAANRGEAQTKRALLVAINTYEPAGTHAAVDNGRLDRGVFRDLRGPVNDAAAMQQILTTIYRFPPGNVRVITEAQATRANILAAIQEQLVEPSARGDTCVFYYAGHGSQVLNSASTEPDKMDETLVPADAITGTRDIRDKELARLFNDVIDCGAQLTVLIDACHSGSIARGVPPGEGRQLPPDRRDIAPELVNEAQDSRPNPEQRPNGAVVFSATQDDQMAYEARDEAGLPHGAFSQALAKALREGSGLSAHGIYMRTKSLMEVEGVAQDPVLAGPRNRLVQPLFGALPEADAGGLVAAIESAEKGEPLLLGVGGAAGIAPGCEFVRVDTKQKPVRLRVETVKSLSASIVRAVEGKASSVSKGDLFRLDRWVGPSDGALRVWIPPALAGEAEVRQIGAFVEKLATLPGITLVNDPTEKQPTHELVWNGSEWELFAVGGRSQSLGATLDAAAIQAALGAGPATLFLNVPPPASLGETLASAAEGDQSMVIRASARKQAHYALAGRWSGGRPEYAWMQVRATHPGLETGPLPPRTDWLAVADAGGGAVGRRLADFATRVAAARAWLVLSAPPDAGYFPYQLALRQVSSGQTLTDGRVSEGDICRLVLLRTDPASVRVVERRYVYAFAIDSFGRRTLLFPAAGHGNVENNVPFAGSEARPAEIALGSPFRISPPPGRDTYVLLASREPIPVPEVVFDVDGVRTRGEAAPVPDESDGLATLLGSVGQATRGGKTTSSRWSIQRLGITTTPARAAP